MESQLVGVDAFSRKAAIFVGPSASWRRHMYMICCACTFCSGLPFTSTTVHVGFSILMIVNGILCILLLGRAWASPTLTMSTPPLSACVYVCIHMCRTSCRIVLFTHSQWVPLANLCRLSGVEGFQEGCAQCKANRLMCLGNHRPKVTCRLSGPEDFQGGDAHQTRLTN